MTTTAASSNLDLNVNLDAIEEKIDKLTEQKERILLFLDEMNKILNFEKQYSVNNVTITLKKQSQPGWTKEKFIQDKQVMNIPHILVLEMSFDGTLNDHQNDLQNDIVQVIGKAFQQSPELCNTENSLVTNFKIPNGGIIVRIDELAIRRYIDTLRGGVCGNNNNDWLIGLGVTLAGALGVFFNVARNN